MPDPGNVEMHYHVGIANDPFSGTLQHLHYSIEKKLTQYMGDRGHKMHA